jgi:malate/lactate dehydrogenase
MNKDDCHINNARDLMERYVEICNESLAQNNNRIPFKQILAAARDAQIVMVTAGVNQQNGETRLH